MRCNQLSNLDFLEKLRKLNKDIIPLEEYKGHHEKILVEDKLGIKYSIAPASLYKHKSNIKTAIDKNNFFLKKATYIHNGKYNYSKVNYINNKSKVKIVCPIHGEFLQTPYSHLSGKGCKKCAMEFVQAIRQSSTEEFIVKANKVHNNKYIYSEAVYTKAINKIKIICPEHGIFEQVAIYHLTGNGCPECALEFATGFKKSQFIKVANKNKKALLYVIKCYNNKEEFIKIGITTLDIKTRYPNQKRLPYSYQILKEIEETPDFIYDKEKELHRLCKPFKYQPLIPFDGQTECFNMDCLTALKENLKF